ncbi:MAG: barnase inhibitor [Alphaproteobacteria bacterium]|nr:barnase inhibitor [Alphaproteobacteria bacterium]
MTRRCILDGAALKDLDAVYDALASQLGFPGHFGRNLDALWDVLTTDLPGPVEIEWRNRAAARRALGADFDRLAKLLSDVGRERPDVRVFES